MQEVAQPYENEFSTGTPVYVLFLHALYHLAQKIRLEATFHFSEREHNPFDDASRWTTEIADDLHERNEEVSMGMDEHNH